MIKHNGHGLFIDHLEIVRSHLIHEDMVRSLLKSDAVSYLESPVAELACSKAVSYLESPVAELACSKAVSCLKYHFAELERIDRIRRSFPPA